MISDISAFESRKGSPDGSAAAAGDARAQARQIIEANDAISDPTRIDRLASALMLRLDHYEQGREFRLAVIAELRSEARRLGYFPQSRYYDAPGR